MTVCYAPVRLIDDINRLISFLAQIAVRITSDPAHRVA
eukprot:SAG31_NODE_16496_length_707_cov_0.789474_1_plen_37_part_10